MKFKIIIISIFIILTSMMSCTKTTVENPEKETTQMNDLAQEKAAILTVLNEETKAAFSRDYEGWQSKWIHETYVTKTYMDFSNNSMTETLGWNEINDFVKTYIEEHPEPDPLPTLVDEINVRLFGNAAWVSYEQNDVERGLKRETRLMEKVENQWKIAGMHTTIYGK